MSGGLLYAPPEPTAPDKQGLVDLDAIFGECLDNGLDLSARGAAGQATAAGDFGDDDDDGSDGSDGSDLDDDLGGAGSKKKRKLPEEKMGEMRRCAPRGARSARAPAKPSAPANLSPRPWTGPPVLAPVLSPAPQLPPRLPAPSPGLASAAAPRSARNREHARRSRCRKKFVIESLQQSINSFQAENDRLRGAIRQRLGDAAAAPCSTSAPRTRRAPSSSRPTRPTRRSRSTTTTTGSCTRCRWRSRRSSSRTRCCPTTPSSREPGLPHAHGLPTSARPQLPLPAGAGDHPRSVAKIRKAIEGGYDVSVCLLNYKIDATTFWNHFFIAALRDGKGSIVNFVGVRGLGAAASASTARSSAPTARGRRRAEKKPAPGGGGGGSSDDAPRRARRGAARARRRCDAPVSFVSRAELAGLIQGQPLGGARHAAGRSWPRKGRDF